MLFEDSDTKCERDRMRAMSRYLFMKSSVIQEKRLVCEITVDLDLLRRYL